jgi:hypothetical protein
LLEESKGSGATKWFGQLEFGLGLAQQCTNRGSAINKFSGIIILIITIYEFEFMRIPKCLASFPIAALLVIGSHSYASARERTMTSPDRSLTITFQESSGCSTGRISGTYSTKSDVSGALYQFDCGKGEDVNFYFFIDTQGAERCYGKMTNSWGGLGGEATRWNVMGAVPGYQCLSVGQTLRQDNMRY